MAALARRRTRSGSATPAPLGASARPCTARPPAGWRRACGRLSALAPGRCLHPTPVWLCRPGQALDPCASAGPPPRWRGAAPPDAPIAATSPSARRSTASTCIRPCRPNQGPTPTSDPAGRDGRRRSSRLPASRRCAASGRPCTARSPWRRCNAGLGAAMVVAYSSLLSAWKDYLAHDNHGRPIIFIGHSQGAAILIKLLQTQIDPLADAARPHGLGHHPRGQRAGARSAGCRRHLPAHPDLRVGHPDRVCHRLLVLRQPPPANSLFGRPGRGVSLQSGQGVAGAAGGLRQPGQLLARARAACCPIS